MRRVHVTQGDDVLVGHLADVVPALPADANAGNVQLLAGRFATARPRRGWEQS